MFTFNSTRDMGSMSGKSKFYKNKTKEEIKKDLLERRKKLGDYFGFDGTKIIVPYQNLDKHKEGHYENVTEMVSDILIDDPNCDLWNLDIPCDIMIIENSLKGVMMAYPVADCPVVMATNGDVIAFAHCGAKEIDRFLPYKVIDALRSVKDIDISDINVLVGPSASKESYIYETYPKWAKNPVWDMCIEEVDNGYSIDLKKTIKLELKYAGLKDCYIDSRDTITNDLFYSNYAAFHGKEDKSGRFLVGAGFKNKEKILRKSR